MSGVPIGGFHEVRLKNPYGILWFLESFSILVYTTCVCWDFSGRVERRDFLVATSERNIVVYFEGLI